MKLLPLALAVTLLGGLSVVAAPGANACVATPDCFGGPCHVTYGETDDLIGGGPAPNARYPDGVECVS